MAGLCWWSSRPRNIIFLHWNGLSLIWRKKKTCAQCCSCGRWWLHEQTRCKCTLDQAHCILGRCRARHQAMMVYISTHYWFLMSRHLQCSDPSSTGPANALPHAMHSRPTNGQNRTQINVLHTRTKQTKKKQNNEFALIKDSFIIRIDLWMIAFIPIKVSVYCWLAINSHENNAIPN